MLDNNEREQLHFVIAKSFQTFGDTDSLYNAANYCNQDVSLS
jgi:hypothetical protein